jgi:hypothetical protein
MWMGILFFPHPSRLYNHVGISQSIHMHFHHGKALPPYCAEKLRWISAPGTRPQKTDHTTLFFLGAAILLCHSTKLNCVMMLKFSISGDKGAICWHECAESSTADPQNIKTCVRILIVLPL